MKELRLISYLGTLNTLRTLGVLGALGAAGAVLPLQAQLTPQRPLEPEVRRAIPVTGQAPTPAPAQLTPSEYPTPIPVMRALPAGTPLAGPPVSVPASALSEPFAVSPSGISTASTRSASSAKTLPTPASIPTPVRQSVQPLSSVRPAPVAVSKAAPPETPLPTPQTAASTPPATPTTDDPGSIRIAPLAASDSAALAASQLAVADGFYGRKQPESAVPEYEKFLIMAQKNAEGRERALYRLGESQRQMGSKIAAEATFLRIMGEYPSGSFTPSASFRLGELRATRGEYANAADNFAFTAKAATDPSIKLAATYQQALCLEKTGKQPEADALLQQVARDQASGSTENPYQVPALMHLAASAAASGKKTEALEFYNSILTSKPTPTGEVLSESALKAALLQSELGKPEAARKLFEKVAASNDSGRWQGVAAIGALRLAAQAGDDAAVLKASETALATDFENKPEILLLQANALRKKGKYAQALEDYDVIIREFPGSKAASLAPFQRLLTLHAARNPSLLSEIDQYLLTASDPADRAKAQLLKAEETLRASRYKEAAQLYHVIRVDSLPPASRPDILYKEAWALLQANAQTGENGDKGAEATAALTRFLEAYPDEERSPATLAQRALLKQQQKDFAGAIADFTLLQERYPKAAERELALQQKALLLGQQQKNNEMVETFTQLLREYPKSQAAPQAHYWIGWTALENKDYEGAVSELALARSGDPKQFSERAGLRILLAQYYLNHPAEAAREAAALKPALIPPEVGRWIGLQAMEAGDPAKAERFLSPLVKEGLPGATDQEIQNTLAASLTAQGKFREAQAPAAACLKLAQDPASRAKALLVAATIQRSMKNSAEAGTMVEEAMLLQPEGNINAEARILSGDLLAARQDYASAAKAYMTVAVLYDDPIITPKALTRAVDAYRKAGNEMEAQKTSEELRNRFPGGSVPAAPKLPRTPKATQAPLALQTP